MNALLDKIKTLYSTKRGKTILIVLPLILVIVMILLILQSNGEISINISKNEVPYLGNLFGSNMQIDEVVNTNYSLKIDKINVNVPIIENVDAFNEEEYLKKIENGVAMMDESSLPGEAGLTFIFGHSKYYDNKPGSYKQVFRELDKLENDDEIVIEDKEGSKQLYQVFKHITVGADAWDEIYKNKDSQDNILTIMTCWPPGETTFRYIVHARLVEE